MAAAILLSYVLMSLFGRVEYAALGLLIANLAMFPYTTREALTMVQGRFFTYILRLLLPPMVLSRGKGRR
jgi:hypothetical protein